MKKIWLSILVTLALLISGCGFTSESGILKQTTVPAETVTEEETTKEVSTEETTTKETAPEPEPAKFVLSILGVTPADASGTSYTATVDVQNTGDLKGTYSLVSKVNDELMDSIQVELSPSQKKTVILPEVQAKVSSLAEQYKNLEIDEQTCTISVGNISTRVTFQEAVPEPEPARFVLGVLWVTPEDASETSYTATVSVQNTGDLKGTYSLVSKVNDELMDSIEVELNPNQKKTIILTEAQVKVSSLAEQYKNLEIDEQTCTVSVGNKSASVTFPEEEYMLQYLSSRGTNYGGVELETTGQVKNISRTSLKDVEVVIEILDSEHELLYSSSKLIYRNPLEPGQTSAFEVVCSVNAQDVKYYNVYFRFKSGEIIPTDRSVYKQYSP